MLIIGLDYHPSVQQSAFLDLETEESGERQLNHNGRRGRGVLSCCERHNRSNGTPVFACQAPLSHFALSRPSGGYQYIVWMLCRVRARARQLNPQRRA
jgi:hypothetical protein